MSQYHNLTVINNSISDGQIDTSRPDLQQLLCPLFSASVGFGTEDFYDFLWAPLHSWEDVCSISSHISSSLFKLWGFQIIKNTILPEIELPVPLHQFYLDFSVPSRPPLPPFLFTKSNGWFSVRFALNAFGDLSLKNIFLLWILRHHIFLFISLTR